MSKILNEVLSANGAYAGSFGAKGDLALPPARRFAILTCMDARLDPAKYAGLSEGDAHVIRNAGGRATDDAIRSLVISHKLLGTNEWFVIHHTNCGMELFADEVIADLDQPPSSRRPRGGPFHQVAYDQESGLQRRPGRPPNPRTSARSQVDSHPWLYL
jgi:carbonic anhydrase